MTIGCKNIKITSFKVFKLNLKREHCTWSCLHICQRCKMFGLAAGENLSQRRPCNGVSSLFSVNKGSSTRYSGTGDYSTYRVSHKTWQFVNSFECLLPYIVLDVKDFLKSISLKKHYSEINFTIIWLSNNILYHSL